MVTINVTWKDHGSNALQNSSCMAPYFPAHKPSE